MQFEDIYVVLVEILTLLQNTPPAFPTWFAYAVPGLLLTIVVLQGLQLGFAIGRGFFRA